MKAHCSDKIREKTCGRLIAHAVSH